MEKLTNHRIGNLGMLTVSIPLSEIRAIGLKNFSKRNIRSAQVQPYQSHNAKKRKKQTWYWDKVHQTEFHNMEDTIAKDLALASPDYMSSKQLGSVITQVNRPIAFFSRKLTEM